MSSITPKTSPRKYATNPNRVIALAVYQRQRTKQMEARITKSSAVNIRANLKNGKTKTTTSKNERHLVIEKGNNFANCKIKLAAAVAVTLLGKKIACTHIQT